MMAGFFERNSTPFKDNVSLRKLWASNNVLSGIVLKGKYVYPVSKERIFETKSNGSGGFDLS